MRRPPLLLCLCLLLASFTILVAGPAEDFQAKEQESIVHAQRLYPELESQKGSRLFNAVAAEIGIREKSNPRFFDNPEWPLLLAIEMASKLGIQPNAAAPSTQVAPVQPSTRDPLYLTVTTATKGMVCDDPILFFDLPVGTSFVSFFSLKASELTPNERASLPRAEKYYGVPAGNTAMLVPDAGLLVSAERPKGIDESMLAFAKVLADTREKSLGKAGNEAFHSRLDDRPKSNGPSDSTIRYRDRRSAQQEKAASDLDAAMRAQQLYLQQRQMQALEGLEQNTRRK